MIVTGSICYQSIILTYSLNQNKLTDLSVVLLFGLFFYIQLSTSKIVSEIQEVIYWICLGFLSILFMNTEQNFILSYTLSPVLLFFTIPLLISVIMWYRISNGISPTQWNRSYISQVAC